MALFAIHLEDGKVHPMPENRLPRVETAMVILLNSIYLYKLGLDQANYMTTNMFFDFSALGYLTGRHVIPQFFGIYQS